MQTRGRDYDQRTSASELVIAIVIQNTVHLALECEVCEGGGGWWKAMPNGQRERTRVGHSLWACFMDNPYLPSTE